MNHFLRSISHGVNSVASEDFADFIAPYFTSPEEFIRSQGTDCIDFVNSTLAVVYIPFSTMTSFSYTSYTYSAVPKFGIVPG